MTLTAKDANGYTATGYNGDRHAQRTDRIDYHRENLGSGHPHVGSLQRLLHDGLFVQARRNLLVTDFLHYYGTKVSALDQRRRSWVTSRFTTAPGGWTDTPVATPFQLVAGTTYRHRRLFRGGDLLFNCSCPYPSSLGTIAEEYETTSGDAFPTSHYNTYMEPVDLLVQVGSYTSVPISPTTVTFAAGVWTGHVMVQQAGTGVPSTSTMASVRRATATRSTLPTCLP